MERSKLPSAGLAIGLVTLSLSACTDANLYRPGFEPDAPNKLTLAGRICTEDYQRRRFPVKVAFVIDSGPEILTNDLTASRAFQIQQIVNRFANDNYEYAFIQWSGDTFDPTLLNEFTDDPSMIDQGVISMMGNVPCQSGGGGPGGTGCRDYVSAVSRLSSLVTGDILRETPGLRARTKYVVIFLANGPPNPTPCSSSALPACDGTNAGMCCNDALFLRGMVETLRDFVQDSGGVDLVFHTVYVENCARSVGANATGASILQEMAFGGAGSFTYSRIPHECFDGDIDPVTGMAIDQDGVGGANTADPDCGNVACGDGTCDFNETLPGCPADCNAMACPDGFCGPAENTTTCPMDCQTDVVPGCGFWEDPAANVGSPPPDTSILFSNVDLDPARSPFVMRSFIVSNVNVLPTDDGVLVDSDADGIDDATEIAIGTDPAYRDTDSDGISDLVELYYEALGFSINDPAMPDRPVDCRGDPPFEDLDGDGLDDDREEDIGTSFTTPDTDGDGLWDCEERVIATEPTLFDSDADGVPDWLELRAGTIPIFADQNLDQDLDGVDNGDEIMLHADPLAYDVSNQLTFNYRYTLIDEGLATLPFIEQPLAVTGVTVESLSVGTVIGTGNLSWNAALRELTWTQFGDDPAQSAPVAITRDGTFDLHSASSCALRGTCTCDLANLDPSECECRTPPPGTMCGSTEAFDNFSGQCCMPGSERFITVRVQEVILPPVDVDEILNVGITDRNCIDFRVRNITLMETLLEPLTGNVGMNSVYVFFGQVPVERPLSYPLYRVSLVRVQYLDATDDAPAVRDPDESEILLVDDDFVLFEF